MKSEQVSRAWEFYRDNCDGFKEPMRKEMRKLDDYVAGVESENAKLRELVSHFYKIALRQCITCPYEPTRECDGCEITDGERSMYRLGIEVDA